jgi:putative intracellular protease/amidase
MKSKEQMAHIMEQNTVHLFVFDSLADWEIGYAVAGINNPAFQAQPGRFRVQTVGLSTSAIHTMGGLAILPDGSLDELDAASSAMLILPGGITWDVGKNTEAVETARRFLDAGRPVAAICAATAALARAGILDNRRHTSNSLDYVMATGYRGAALYENQPAVIGDNVITASGIAPLEFARCIFDKLGIYAPDTLDAWYKLFKTGDLSQYAVLAKLP